MAVVHRKPAGGAKRALWKIALACLLIVAVHFGIDRWENRALQSRIDALHAAGAQVVLEDFSNSDAPDNGARDITAAAAILDDDGDDHLSIETFPTTRPTPAAAWPYLESAVAHYAPALARMDRAAGRKHWDWNHRFKSPVMENVLLSELRDCRCVAGLLAVSAMVEHHHHRDGAALTRLSQLLVLSRAAENSPSLVGHQCAVGLAAFMVERLESILPEMQIGGGGPDAASIGQIRSLIDSLLDESALNQGRRCAFADERMATLDMYRSQIFNQPFLSYLMDPLLVKIECDQLDEQTAVEAAANSSCNLPDATRKISKVPDRSSDFIYISSRPALIGVVRTQYALSADRRLAAAALGVRLYRLEHGGSFPPDLNALVPTYLPAVPLDPMAAADKRINYILRTGDPILYSVGFDATDDGGSEAGMPGRHGELGPWQRLDRVFHLGSATQPYLYVPYPYGTNARQYISLEPPWERKPPWERATTQPANGKHQ